MSEKNNWALESARADWIQLQQRTEAMLEAVTLHADLLADLASQINVITMSARPALYVHLRFHGCAPKALVEALGGTWQRVHEGENRIDWKGDCGGFDVHIFHAEGGKTEPLTFPAKDGAK